MSNDSSRKKKLLFLAGSTYIIIMGGLLVMISLVLAIILLGYMFREPESPAERVVRKRPALVTFDDLTATPVTNAGVASSQTSQPAVDTSSDVDVTEAGSENPTGNGSVDSVEVAPGIQTEDIPPQTDSSATPSPTSGPASNLPTPLPTPTAEVILVSSVTPTSTPTSAPTPTITPSLTPTDVPAATPIPTNTPTPTPVPGSITGRVLLNGTPVDGVTIRLEDQALNPIAETTVGSGGTYDFSNLAATNEGYNLVFAQERNTQYQLDQVVSWGWLGPIPVADGTVAQIPDFDISLLGFEPTIPAPNTSFSIASVSSSNPIQFEWVAYPEATKYWVDLARGQDQNVVWQSSIASSTSVSFDGTLSSGSQIQPGEYWWGVGARRDLGAYKLTVYGYLPVLLIVP